MKNPIYVPVPKDASQAVWDVLDAILNGKDLVCDTEYYQGPITTPIQKMDAFAFYLNDALVERDPDGDRRVRTFVLDPKKNDTVEFFYAKFDDTPDRVLRIIRENQKKMSDVLNGTEGPKGTGATKRDADKKAIAEIKTSLTESLSRRRASDGGWPEIERDYAERIRSVFEDVRASAFPEESISLVTEDQASNKKIIIIRRDDEDENFFAYSRMLSLQEKNVRIYEHEKNRLAREERKRVEKEETAGIILKQRADAWEDLKDLINENLDDANAIRTSVLQDVKAFLTGEANISTRVTRRRNPETGEFENDPESEIRVKALRDLTGDEFIHSYRAYRGAEAVQNEPEKRSLHETALRHLVENVRENLNERIPESPSP